MLIVGVCEGGVGIAYRAYGPGATQALPHHTLTPHIPTFTPQVHSNPQTQGRRIQKMLVNGMWG